jgi:hypothetical protein
MSRFWRLSLCFATAMIEGIDLQSMGLVAPRLGPQFHLSHSQMGLALAAAALAAVLLLRCNPAEEAGLSLPAEA